MVGGKASIVEFVGTLLTAEKIPNLGERGDMKNWSNYIPHALYLIFVGGGIFALVNILWDPISRMLDY